jgi:hypothetical protein
VGGGRAADPEALYFGDRLPIYYDPAAVRAMAFHVDAIDTNYNVDSSDGWIAPYNFDGLRQSSGGKPVLEAQGERATGAAAATRAFAAIPQIIGAHWFQYYDLRRAAAPRRGWRPMGALSGVAPVAAMEEPAVWRAMWLGDGARLIETAPAPSGRAPG